MVVALVAVLRYDSTGRKGNKLSKPFIYDVGEMAQIDPNLVLYEREGLLLKTGFDKARCITIDSADNVYVSGDAAIRIFDPTGNAVGEIELSEAPRPVAVDAEGVIYVGLSGHVEVYNRQGERLARWEQRNDRALLTSIAVDGNDIFVADAGNRVVLHYNGAGDLLKKIGEKDEQRNIPGFLIPTPYFDLTIAPDGLLRVINPGNHRIEAYTYRGDLEFSWGRFSGTIDGFCGCCNPVNFAILPDESFVTVEKGLIRAKLYDPLGDFVGVVAGPEQLGVDGPVKICQFPEQCQSGGFDVAVDSNGRIFVLNTINNEVRIFSRKAGT